MLLLVQLSLQKSSFLYQPGLGQGMETLRAKAIIEMLGAPKEHIAQVLKDFVERKLKAPGSKYEVLSADYSEPSPQGKLFAAFVELDLSVRKADDLLDFCFEAMPSSIEVYQPEKLSWDLSTMNRMLNDLASRIHQADTMLKTVRSESVLLNKNSIELLRNFVRYLVREGNNTLEKVSAKIGIGQSELKPFLNRMIEENALTLEGDLYKIP